jgi:hypothetical protein
MPYTDRPADLKLADQTLDSVATWLRERDIDVILPEQAAERLPSDLRYCRQEECAHSYIQYLEVDYAVLSTVRGHPKAKGSADISVSLVTRDEKKFQESRAISESLWLSVDAALTHVYSDFLSAITALPETEPNATVSSQGQPSTRASDPSANALQVSHEAVSPGAVAIPTSEASGASDRPALHDSPNDVDKPKASPWNYVLGGIFAAAAVPLIAVPVVGLAKQNDCNQSDTSTCPSGSGLRNVALLTGGAVALAAGAFFLLVRPINP